MVDGFLRDFDGTKYLILFGLENFIVVNDRIRYLIVLKSGIRYVFYYIYAKIKVDSDDDLSLEETLTLHNIVILINSILTKIKITATRTYS